MTYDQIQALKRSSADHVRSTRYHETGARAGEPGTLTALGRECQRAAAVERYGLKEVRS